MNIFSIIYIINVFLGVKSEFEIIKLLYQDNKFYIPIKLSKEYNEEYFIFSTMLPVHFFPSKECSICSYKYINENDSNYYSFIQSDVSLLYYFHNLTGNAYRTNITLGTEKSEMDIIAIHYLNDYDEYNASCDGLNRPKRTIFERSGTYGVAIRQTCHLLRRVAPHR